MANLISLVITPPTFNTAKPLAEAKKKTQADVPRSIKGARSAVARVPMASSPPYVSMQFNARSALVLRGLAHLQ
jgi:hypothetical protein